MAAAEVQHAQPRQFTECGEGRADPSLVIEIIVIVENETARVAPKCGGTIPSLRVMKSLFAVEAIRRAHDLSILTSFRLSSPSTARRRPSPSLRRGRSCDE